MKLGVKEIKILYMYVKLKHKEADRNKQDQKETDRNSRSREDYSSDIENYCIIKKFISEIGKREVIVRCFVLDAKMTDNSLNI